jgi:hypothetical protein
MNNATATITVPNIQVQLTVAQLITAVRQLESTEQQQIIEALSLAIPAQKSTKLRQDWAGKLQAEGYTAVELQHQA